MSQTRYNNLTGTGQDVIFQRKCPDCGTWNETHCKVIHTFNSQDGAAPKRDAYRGQSTCRKKSCCYEFFYGGYMDELAEYLAKFRQENDGATCIIANYDMIAPAQ